MAVSSVFLIWARRTERAYRAGMRYLVVQVGSGVLLMAGAMMRAEATGSVDFGPMGLGDAASALIFLAFGIKCAFPLLHNWLQDAYPEATVTGTVFLSAFTTKTAVYALARGYPGTEVLVYIGAVMTAFPIFYAVIENDLRRVLAYSLNNQLGFMVVGIGVGSQIAINGAVGHAFVHILYKALLFMSMGAVLYRAGTIKGSELGGLYKSMPLTTVFCIVGAASISAFPLFSGFVAKSLTLTGVAEAHLSVIWLVLMFASAGVFHHSGIKIPYFAFFAHDSGIRCKEAPLNMLVAMGLTAAGCIILGVYSPLLYGILPHPTAFEPYTATHVIGQTQLLMFSALAFAVLIRYGFYPPELRSTNLDFDWVYRTGAPRLIRSTWGVIWPGYVGILQELRAGLDRFIAGVFRHHGPGGALARTWPTGSTALWVAVLLGGLLVLYYAGVT
jgi:multicomponent Na+:H+ antiporter subunit D